MSNYPQGQPSSAYLLRGSPAYNRRKEVYVLSLTRLGVRTNFSGFIFFYFLFISPPHTVLLHLDIIKVLFIHQLMHN
jgi:hypothetical protein